MAVDYNALKAACTASCLMESVTCQEFADLCAAEDESVCGCVCTDVHKAHIGEDADGVYLYDVYVDVEAFGPQTYATGIYYTNTFSDIRDNLSLHYIGF